MHSENVFWVAVALITFLVLANYAEQTETTVSHSTTTKPMVNKRHVVSTSSPEGRSKYVNGTDRQKLEIHAMLDKAEALLAD